MGDALDRWLKSLASRQDRRPRQPLHRHAVA